MNRIFALLFFSFSLYASPTSSDFNACYQKNKKAYVNLYGVNALTIDKNHAVFVGAGKRPSEYIKYDPFLNLYLLKSKNELSPVRKKSEFKLLKYEWIASIAPNTIKISKFNKYSDGFSPFDKLTNNGQKNAIATGVCCQMYGISVGDGKFIANRYLKHFLKYKNVYYGDIGVRFGIRNNAIIVLHVNPFKKSGDFRRGDEILSVNGKSIKSFRHLKEIILFSKNGDILNFVIKRDKKKINIKAEIFPWNLVNKKVETFLEYIGISFNKNLVITKIYKNSFASKLGLKEGDKLLEIDKVSVKSPKEVQMIIANPNKNVFNLLFDRKEFQFFVKVTH